MSAQFVDFVAYTILSNEDVSFSYYLDLVSILQISMPSRVRCLEVQLNGIMTRLLPPINFFSLEFGSES